MSIDPLTPVGTLVAERPARSRVFEKHGIDYCCAGKRSLSEACRSRRVDVADVIAELERSDAAQESDPVADPAAMSLSELVEHIERTHHQWLRNELPRLDALTLRVQKAHGAADARLGELRRVFSALEAKLISHMRKEEAVLFPMIRALDRGQHPLGPIAGAIAQMEHEHDDAGAALEAIRAATDGYRAPPWACPTYRAMLEGLERLELDMHQHVHKENNVLFPRAVELAAQPSSG